MWWFGEDFLKARRQWLYPALPMQGLFRSILLTVLIFILYQFFLELFFTVLVNATFFDGTAETIKNAYEEMRKSGQTDNIVIVNLFKSALIGTFPATAIATIVAVAASHYGLPKMAGTLPLQWPKIGPFGWLIIILGFWLLTMLVSIVIFAALGLDPSHESGLVENALKSLASDKGLFLLAVPGAVIGAPLIEEILFRGILFAGLRPRVGGTGTVLITAALWAAAHLGAAPIAFALTIFVMGILLGILMLRFGSLWVTIACHTAWNFVATLELFRAGAG